MVEFFCGDVELELLDIRSNFKNKAGDIPQLVRKMFVSANTVFGKLHVVARRSAHDERETNGIGAIFFYHVDRVDDIAERLTHLPSFFISHKTVQVDVFERYRSQMESAHEYHARDPEKKDIVARFKKRGRVICCEIVCFFRPSERGKGP